MAPTPEQLKEWYRQMLTIRNFEESIFDLYTRAEMPGLAHLSIGQEAVAVGVMAALEPQDYIISTHRGHGHCIAKGADINALTAELLGRVTGLCRGKGGTMHVADMAHRNIGATGIVGGQMGMATGIALAAKLRHDNYVTACFFGDGAANQGIFSESMNLAKLWHLPLLFLCENNQFGEYTPWRDVTGSPSLESRAQPYEISHQLVDGMDVIATYEASKAAVDSIRAGNGPQVIECETYRFGGHHVGDPPHGLYRTAEDIEEWRPRDAIVNLGAYILDNGIVDDKEKEEIEAKALQEIKDGVTYAKNSPWPELEELEMHVYA